MAGRRTVSEAVCPDHEDGRVTAHGSFVTTQGRTQRFRCASGDGDEHTFSVKAPSPAELLAGHGVAPPVCPEHPGSHVVRWGTYGTTTGKRRQRYKCSPADGSSPHRFTPVLPRECVRHGAEQCDTCDEVRGLHRGETAVARTHSWNTRTVARGLEMLAMGQSYASVSRWALRTSGTRATRTRTAAKQTPSKQPKTRSEASRLSRNAWHVAADWCEAFAPVVFDPLDRRLRAAALAERERLDGLREAGAALDRPQVILLDDVPVYGRTLDRGKRARRDDGFAVLVLAELHWPEPDNPFSVVEGSDPAVALRLVRAMAKSNGAAWRLLFDELGYAPDFVVADAGTGIGAAVREHFDSSRTRFIPSLWHLTRAIEADLLAVKAAVSQGRDGKVLIRPLRKHLGKLSRSSGVLDDATTWTAWWDELLALLTANGLPVEKARKHRKSYEGPMAAALALAPKQVPVSTGGLETLISSHVKRMLEPRRTGFANIERTNHLFDLVVARQHGAFDNLAEVARLLREDSQTNDGYTVALRTVADPRPVGGSYSSLRDPTLLNDLARRRGLL